MNARDFKKAPRPSQVIGVMDVGARYKSATLAAKFGCATSTMTVLLRQMVEEGAIESMVEGTQRKYHLPVEASPAVDVVARSVRVFTPPLTGQWSSAWKGFADGCMGTRR